MECNHDDPTIRDDIRGLLGAWHICNTPDENDIYEICFTTSAFSDRPSAFFDILRCGCAQKVTHCPNCGVHLHKDDLRKYDDEAVEAKHYFLEDQKRDRLVCAAPDLLDALRALLADCEAVGMKPLSTDKARAAIAAATGEGVNV